MRLRILSTLTALLLVGGPALAQAAPREVSDLRSEFAQLRRAAELEAGGDAAAAEGVVRAVLERNPGSLSGLLALERLLLVQARLPEILPVAERVLRDDAAATVAHQVRIRALLRLDRIAELERAAAQWIGAVPELETPYREVAQAWLARNDPVRALGVLEQGRARLGSETALALEIGNVYAAAGDYERAAREWSRAIGTGGQGLAPVQRRLAELPAAGAGAIPVLVRMLETEPTSLARRRAAARLALDAGLGDEAERLAGRVLRELPAEQRESYVAEVARRADGAGLHRLALWSYDQLLRSAEGDTTRLLALRTRVAQLAMETGDTARAARVFASLEEAAAPGSPERRQAFAARLSLQARELGTTELVAALDSFRTEYPAAPESDTVHASVGATLLARGELAAAERALVGVGGARAALLRGRLFLRRGDLPRARTELLLAAPELRGAEATGTIATASALARLDAPAGELLARALEQPDAGAAVDTLVAASGGFPERQRAAILEFAAGLADGAGLVESAVHARAALIEQAPSSDAVPAALLWLGTRAAAHEATRAEARVLLERLIIEHPRSALVPQARRILEGMPGQAPGRA